MKVFGYMDATDFSHELGQAAGGVTIYSSEKDILEHCPCAASCGVVKVSIEFVENVTAGDNSGSLLSSDIDSKNDAYIESEKAFINHCKEQAFLLQKRTDNLRSLAEKREKSLFKLKHPAPKINKIVDNTEDSYPDLVGAKHLVCHGDFSDNVQIYFSNIELDINNSLVIKDDGDWRWVCRSGHNRGYETPEAALDDYLFFARDQNWLR